jgi:DNA-directed RNA polymerase specialized sigma24 family protein
MYATDLSIHQESSQDAFHVVVMHALELRPVFRNVFLLCEIQSFTIDEAATILGISPDAAQLRLDRARRELSIKMRAES